MAKLLILAVALAALPAAAQSFLERLEKRIDRHTEKFFDEVKREQIETLANGRRAQDRVEAARALSGHREPEVVEALGKALSDPEVEVRLAAARGLWRIEKHAAPARPHLVKALDDPDPNVVAQAAGALQASGTPAAELAAPRRRVFAAASATPESRFLVSRSLIGQEPAVRILEATLAYLYKASTRHNVELAEKALERLVEASQDATLFAPLREELAGPRPEAILRALSMYEAKPEGWMPLLVSLMQSPQPRIRSEALRELGRLGERAAPALEKIVAALEDPDKGVRRNAARAIGQVGDEKLGRAALQRAAQDPEQDVRSEAKDALAKLERIPQEREWEYRNALLKNDVERVKRSLDRGMKPAIVFGPDACHPGVRPTRAETKAILAMMLERGADPNAAAEHGMTPLMDAARYGCDREVMRMLIKAGAKVDARSETGFTAFEQGLWMAHDGLEELIAAGYRLPPDKVKVYTEGYKDRPAAQAMIRKASPRK